MHLFYPSIPIKLLLVLLPLVCTPIVLVGYLSYDSSVQSVMRLSRDKQILQAKVAAAEIDALLQSCLADLETLGRILIDHYRLEALGPKIQRDQVDQIITLFKDFIVRSPYYLQIRLTDLSNNTILSIVNQEVVEELIEPSEETLPSWDGTKRNERRFFISRITPTSVGRYYMYLAKPILRMDDTLTGAVIIDLDFEKVIDLVTTLGIGEQGYAFLVDQLGHTIAHPDYAPYQYDFTKYDDASTREFIINMITGESGWAIFNLEGPKMAAYAPVDATRWSLAVSTPLEAFRREAEDMRRGVIQVVMAAIILTVGAVVFISYRLLGPIKRLAAAADQIAMGDLNQEIPVKSRDELGMLTRSFNHMTCSLKAIQMELVASEKLISLGRLSAGVAHEIRNPLNAMKGAISYLQRRRSDDALSLEYLGLIQEEIDRLGQFVNDFLCFARQAKPRRVPTDINGMLQASLVLFTEELRNSKISVETAFDPLLPIIDLDPRQMEQVVMNLLINAIHAMPKGGELKLTTRRRNETAMNSHDGIVLTIEDDGAGISPKVLNNIFDPFFSTKDSGTGLGLTISLGIVEGHGGTIKVASTKGKGTVVTIDLPARGSRVVKENGL